MRGHFALMIIVVAACGSTPISTPEQAISGAKDGDKLTITGQVHAVTFDSKQQAARKLQLANHPDSVEWVLEQDDEQQRGIAPAYMDTNAKYPRTPDHYVLFRTQVPDGITLAQPGFNNGRLPQAWGLGVHLTDIDPAQPMPELGATIKVTGTFAHVAWNARDTMMPVLEDATIEIVDGPAPLAGPGEHCDLDQACNARLICDRAAHTCQPPPREIYWADPWHDVNGACTTDDDCPLGQVCDQTYTMGSTGDYAAFYFPSQDVGRHLCVLAPGATVASQCPRIYSTRDLQGGRFVTGKEICVKVVPFIATQAEDHDTHDQMFVDEPIPYPTADAQPNVFGATTENGPPFKDPARPGGALPDPTGTDAKIAIGTYRYDPDHGWYELHPVKAYLPAP
ncbi:MAG TPA: hypothetical protein VL463_13955 [Kofleriaceae bacterium]|nr:hypothetical protein [Kofleriaceae bacterium]